MKQYSNGAIVLGPSNPYGIRKNRCLLTNFQYFDRAKGYGTFNLIDASYCIDRIELEEVSDSVWAQEPWPEGLPFIGG